MYSCALSLASALDGGGKSMPHPSHFTPWKDPVPIAWEAESSPGPVWTGMKSLATTRIWSLDQHVASRFTDYTILAHSAWWRLQIMKLLIIGSSPHLAFSLLGQNIVNTIIMPSVYSSLILQDVSHLHKTTGKIIGLYNLIFPILKS
jgi:hypothetical protein